MKIDWLPYGLALSAILIPILIHLLNRRQGKILNIGSVRFLKSFEVQKARSIKLHELILLMLRISLITLIVFYFINPTAPGIGKINFKPKNWLVGDTTSIKTWLKLHPEDSLKTTFKISEENNKSKIFSQLLSWNNSDTLPLSVMFLSDWRKFDIPLNKYSLNYEAFLVNPFYKPESNEKIRLIGAVKDSVYGDWVYQTRTQNDTIYFESNNEISSDTILYTLNFDSTSVFKNTVKYSLEGLSYVSGIQFLEVNNPRISDFVFTDKKDFQLDGIPIVYVTPGNRTKLSKTAANYYSLTLPDRDIIDEKDLLIPYFVSSAVLQTDTTGINTRIPVYEFISERKLKPKSKLIEFGFVSNYRKWILTIFLLLFILERVYSRKVSM
ncbi:BatA domain-containing protein [Marinigracilibium pacificum]|uniref:Aerotolerance regulator N-terminal domain-containing protein n=1 Tax=Marinigracilibium pacificum TaxID=2729599 RepID=A0A848IYS5_9BACT|nr:BatA domain-containing protein [Marinigracilibium pacificum]NMM48425.1 hypothetical protein [Marinigracilibium pacificum]